MRDGKEQVELFAAPSQSEGMRLGLSPDALERLTAADLDDMEEGRRERLGEMSLLISWAVHQIIGSQADEAWRQKYGSFRNFLEFFRPPFYIGPDEDVNE